MGVDLQSMSYQRATFEYIRLCIYIYNSVLGFYLFRFYISHIYIKWSIKTLKYCQSKLIFDLHKNFGGACLGLGL